VSGHELGVDNRGVFYSHPEGRPAQQPLGRQVQISRRAASHTFFPRRTPSQANGLRVMST
jgi:hypothetical protein